MTTERTLALALPDRDNFIRDIKAINEFQQIVHQHLIEGADWGIIPGTQKPTLLKPGAEKIAKLLGLTDTYEILEGQEDWQKPFFHFLVKCKLVSVRDNIVISEGLGECNSMESKYRYRWIGERDLPSGIDKTKLVAQERRSKTGGHWTVYRLDNEDIFSQVNTILKMAKKRALVDAALSAGRLSDVFTQDIEDIPNIIKEDEASFETQPAPKIKTSAPSTKPKEMSGSAIGRGSPPVAPELKSSPAKEKSSVVAPKEAGKTVEFDPSPIRNFGNLWTRCKNYGISKVEGLASLKVKSQDDIADLDDAWRAIFKDRFPEVKI